MDKKNLDWGKLTFSYTKANKMYVSYFKDGKWDNGQLVDEDTINISASSTALHYGQECFEGLKAYTNKNGNIQLFRPDQNAIRLQDSCKRLLMEYVSVEQFIDACKQVVKANEEFVPPYGTGATLYLRPFVIGIGDNLGVRPASEYLFCVFCSPVGAYFKGGMTPVNFITTDYDRAAPKGTGGAKVGGNYAASLLAHKEAVDKGFADCIYLDPTTHTKIEEVGAANFFGITKDDKFVTPKSDSILPSITRRSLMYVAEHYLKMPVEERDVLIDKLDEFKEAGACGTAAVISPIGGIQHNDKMHVFYDLKEVGPVTKKLYDTLVGIQFGDVEAPEGWIVEIK